MTVSIDVCHEPSDFLHIFQLNYSYGICVPALRMKTYEESELSNETSIVGSSTFHYRLCDDVTITMN